MDVIHLIKIKDKVHAKMCMNANQFQECADGAFFDLDEAMWFFRNVRQC